MTGSRLVKGLLLVAALGLAAVWILPLFLRGPGLRTAWWALAAAGLLCLATQWVAWVRLQRRLAAEAPPLQPGSPVDIDFDRPWKGGRA